MKKIFVLSVLTSVAMICSCQKQHASAEQQLAQRKAELDARQKALDERDNALDERENALLAEREKVLAEKDALAKKEAFAKRTAESNARTDPTSGKGQTAGSGQVNPRINEVPEEVRPLIIDTSEMRAAVDKINQARAARQQQLELEQQRAVMPAAQGNSPNASGVGPK